MQSRKKQMDRQRKNATIAYLLLSLLAGYVWCICAFPHVHIVDGVRIVHSHPFSDQSGGDHQHSHNELVVFTALSHFYTEPPTFSPVFSDQQQTGTLLFGHILICRSHIGFTDNHRRAPPFFLS